MIRTFATHKIRYQRELTGCLWQFTPCQGEHKGTVYKVAVPCCWESHPGFAAYRGEGEYTTSFEGEGTIRLEFKGVSHTATVFLDGKEIVRHYNAYTGFDCIVKNLAPGEHTLTIRADNRFSEDSALHIPNDYMSYGGVSRPVLMEKIDDVYIKYVHVMPFLVDNGWRAKIEVCLTNVCAREHCTDVEVELAGKKVVWSNERIPADTEIKVCAEESFDNIQTWTPEHPVLYMVRALLLQDGKEIDDQIDRMGFREIAVHGKDILLNKKKLKIRGVCRHEDHPQFGCALPYEAMAADLELIKDLGANSVRTAHYPNDERFLDLCDEQGILIWEENHARGLSEEDMRNENFEAQAEQVIDEMIEAHYNHPCIYIWGILNECASDSEYGKECYQKQFERIRSKDCSRPCSFASCKFKTDICFGLPDVVSYNIYPLWYHDTPADEYLDDLYQWVQQKTEGRGKPFLITEIGAGGIYGCRNPYHSKWTEEYQAETLDKQLTAVLDYEDCSGVYIWQFCDIRVSDEWFGGRPRTMNNKGIVDEYRRPKLCYDVVKNKYLNISAKTLTFF